VPEEEARRIRAKLKLDSNQQRGGITGQSMQKRSLEEGSVGVNNQLLTKVNKTGVGATGGGGKSDVKSDQNQFSSNRGPSGFLPPRKLPANPVANLKADAETRGQGGQQKQFSFKTRQNVSSEESSLISKPHVVSASLFSSLEPSKRAVENVQTSNSRNRFPSVLTTPAPTSSVSSFNLVNQQQNETPAAVPAQGVSTSAFKTAYEQLVKKLILRCFFPLFMVESFVFVCLIAGYK